MRFVQKRLKLKKIAKMRNRFEVQREIGLKPIEETPLFPKSRDDFPAVVSALLKIYKNSDTTHRYSAY